MTFAPCKPEDRGYLAEMMESVEDIPQESINAGLPWIGRPSASTSSPSTAWTRA